MTMRKATSIIILLCLVTSVALFHAAAQNRTPIAVNDGDLSQRIDPDKAQPPSLTLTANPATISAGASSTLTWTSYHVKLCTGSGGWSGHKARNGSLSVSPASTTSYTLTCETATGVISATATVTVGSGSLPTVTLTANPPSTIAGYWVTLNWSTTNATSCTASGGWTGTQPTSGSVQVAIPVTTAYALTCSGAGGSNHATATATITSAPVVTLTASSSSIQSGGNTTLTWSATNTSSCTASGNDWTGSKPVSGSASVSPASSTTYTLSCSWAGGSANASTVVLVDAPAFSIAVSGNHFVNAAGSTVQLRGVNLSGLEGVAVQGWDPEDPTGGGWGQAYNPNWSAINAWKANIVRIPLNEDSWLGLTCTDTSGIVHNADPGSNYRNAVLAMVQEVNLAGLYAILDLHWAAPGNSCPMLQSQMADSDHSVAFWTSIANTFGSPNGTHANPAVMFELFNEPFLDFDFTGDQWEYMMFGKNGSFSGYPASSNDGDWQNVLTPWNIASYQSMITAIRNTGAKNVVLIGSVSYTGDLSEWLSHVPTDPAQQMASTWHAYPTYGQTWENPCTGTDTYCTPNYSPQIYTDVQGIMEAGYPVLITETGDHNAAGTVGSPLVTNVTTFADAPGTASSSSEPDVSWPAVAGGLPQIGVIGWTWDVWGNPDDVLIKDGNGTPTDGYGQFFQSWMVSQ